VKKLKIDELQVESFPTSVETVMRGTVIGHYSEDNYISCVPVYCQTQEGFATCAPDQCTGGGTTSENETLCGGTDQGTNCCHPYNQSLDWTYCDDTMCC
jgi:hypothetical protein